MEEVVHGGREGEAEAAAALHNSSVRERFNYVPVPRAEQLPDALRLGGL